MSTDRAARTTLVNQPSGGLDEGWMLWTVRGDEGGGGER